MAEASSSSDYRCLVCFSPCQKPKILQCYHTFCESCLDKYIIEEHKSIKEDEDFFPCPVCDTPIYPKDCQKPPGSWAATFPNNLLFQNRPAVDSECGDRYCDECFRGQEKNRAEYWCNDCTEALCEQCRNFHKRNKRSMKHSVVAKTDFSDVKYHPFLQFCEYCPKHTDETLKFFCLDDQVLCCSECRHSSHRECHDVKTIIELVKENLESQSSYDGKWQEIELKTKALLSKDEEEIITLSRKQENASKEMTQMIKIAKQKLDELNAHFQSDLQSRCQNLQETLSNHMKIVREFHINAANSNLLMSRFPRDVSNRLMFIVSEQIKSQILKHFRQFKRKLTNQHNEVDITMKIDNTVQTIVNKLTTVSSIEVSSFISPLSQNTVDEIEHVLSVNSLTAISSNPVLSDTLISSDLKGSIQKRSIQRSEGTSPVNRRDVLPTPVKTVQQKYLEGKHIPCLTGGMFTNVGELLLTDSKNNRVLLLGDNYCYIKDYKLDGSPTDITHGRSADEVFVTVDHSWILFCTLQHDRLVVTTKIRCQPNTWGIALLGDNIVAGTSENVALLSLDGRVLKSFSKTGKTSYVAVSPSQRTFYHKDNHDVICLRQGGAEVFRYRDPNLKRPRGICLDQDDNVYVCGFGSNNVHVISGDGSAGKVFLATLGIRYPYGIVAHPKKRELIITSAGETVSFQVYKY